MTMVRIRSFASGQNSQFQDIRYNLVGSQAPMDNIFKQALSLGDQFVFIGDHTWSDMFPGCKRHYHRDCLDIFKVKNNSCDKFTEKSIWDDIGKGDWKILVAHFMDIDHVAHGL